MRRSWRGITIDWGRTFYRLWRRFKLSEDEAGDFYLKREAAGLLYAVNATAERIFAFDVIARPLYDKYFRKKRTSRYIDFNQGLDARLVTAEKMKKLSEINIRPLRIAFDHYDQQDIYTAAIRKAAKYGITDLSNYLLYNFEDKPEELYYKFRDSDIVCDDRDISDVLSYYRITRNDAGN